MQPLGSASILMSGSDGADRDISSVFVSSVSKIL